MISLLLFSEEVNPNRKTWHIALIYCAFIFVVLGIFSLLSIWHDKLYSTDSFFFTNSLIIIFIAFICPSLPDMRKKLPEAEKFFQKWLSEKKGGKLRFIIKRVGIFLGVILLLFLCKIYLVNPLPLPSTFSLWDVLPVSLAAIALIAVNAIAVWHLNLKYEDRVKTLIAQAWGK